MIITAKFASVCPSCAGRIEAGSKVEWVKGEKARHVKCPAAGTAARATPPRAPRAPRGPRYPESAPEAGAHEISGRRNGRDDRRYDVGQVLYAPKVTIPGGGPDGHYYVVLACRLNRPNEDMGWYDWTECAWVRAATAEEAETKAASMRRAAAPKVVAEYVTRTIRAGKQVAEEDAGSAIPSSGVDVVWSTKGGDLHRVAVVGDVVIGYHGGSYDDYRAVAWRCAATPTLVLAVRALASGNADDLAVAADAVGGAG